MGTRLGEGRLRVTVGLGDLDAEAIDDAVPGVDLAPGVDVELAPVGSTVLRVAPAAGDPGRDAVPAAADPGWGDAGEK